MKVTELDDAEIQRARQNLDENILTLMRDNRKRLTSSDFEALALIGKGAFGEVRLVRMKDKNSGGIYAMKSMIKSAMINKNQVGHVRAERDILTESETQWVVTLHYSFQDENNLYMVMDYLPGGGLLISLYSHSCSEFYP